MQVSAKGAPVARRWAQTLYLVLACLILLAIFLQGFLIGAFLFAGAIWGRDAHSIVGLSLLVLSLLLALVGLLAQVPGRTKVWGFLLFVLMIIQFILPSTSGSVPLLAALHPANAMVLFGLSLFLIFRIRQVMQAIDWDQDNFLSESLETIIPDILDRLPPQTITPAHQQMVRTYVNQLSQLTQKHHATIHEDLKMAFEVAKYSDIPEEEWAKVERWFKVQIDRAKKK